MLKLSRINKQLIMWFFDCVFLLLALLASFLIRIESWNFSGNDLFLVILVVPIIATPIFILFGLYNAIIRYISFNAIWSGFQAVSLYAVLWGIFVFIIELEVALYSIIFINWILSFLSIVGMRIIARFVFNSNVELSLINFKINNIDTKNKSKVLVYGAGDAGVQLVLALGNSSEYRSVGFIDDNQSLHGKQINGLTIYSKNEINSLIVKHKVNEIFIALPSTSRARRLEIINELELYPVMVRLLPSVSDLIQGKVRIEDLHQISIKDLLGRESVKANKSLLGKNITNKVVLVTGAGGSIGFELCKQIVSLSPKALILYEMSEVALYTIEKELFNFCDHLIDIYPILGSVNNKNRISKVLKHFEVDTIYHAAAYKHVPIVEFNNTEGVENNIFGTLNCAQAAIDNSVETFVMISTDKAVRPSNTMGATKRVAELIIQALSAKQNGTKFSMVRFGNVLNSSGSVIPLFKKQIKEGGPVTVTDKDIIRYFMTTSEAVELVIQAGAMAQGGDVFVLDMGKPVRIQDLAEKMIHLSGFNVKDELHPGGDIEIKYIGLRAGEKLYEELLIGNNVSKTDNPLIMRAKEDMLPWDELLPILEFLSDSIDHGDFNRLRKLLIQLVPDFKPQCEVSDILNQDK